MNKSVWYKVYFYLNNKYFKRNKMIVKLLVTDEYTATYQIIRNQKVITTRLDDFIKLFEIVNYGKIAQ